MEDMLTYQEVADRLKCSVRNVRLLVKQKRLPVVVLGHKTRRVPSTAVDAYLRGEQPGIPA